MHKRLLLVTTVTIWFFLSLLLKTEVIAIESLNNLNFPPCPFHSITGIQCPGCGMTRALIAIINMDLKRAVAFNPFSLILIFFFIVNMLPAGKLLDNLFLRKKIYHIVGVAILTWWFFTRFIPSL